MNTFDEIIGYENIKNELLQVCDILHNREFYEKLGAKLPRGIILYGDPGLGKSLMAKCFIKESGLNSYTIRKNKGDDFVAYIEDTFKAAKENAPSVICLDDLDKFANEDYYRCDAEEYVAVQAGIDDVKDFEVFVIATANDIDKLPDSLVRAGRFDKKIEVSRPTDEDACKIIKHYLKDKKLSDSVNFEDLTKMISYSSCAELETIINEAELNAAYARRDKIETEDILNAVLIMQYHSPKNFASASPEELQKAAFHEAGHIVVSEMLCPGSVGLASIRSMDENDAGGFIHRCKKFSNGKQHIMVSLAGKAAVELYFCDRFAEGAKTDLKAAIEYIRNSMEESGAYGIGFLDVEGDNERMSDVTNIRNEAVTYSELERYLLMVKDILFKNRSFLEKIAEELMKKETLLFSDIQSIKEGV